MFDRRKWLLFVLPGLVLLGAITFVVNHYFQFSTSDTLASAQLVLTLLLLPTVLIGFNITVEAFNITIEEFRKRQELPDLDVFFVTETGSRVECLEFNSRNVPYPASNPIALVVFNKGSTIAIWYAIKLNMPVRHVIPNEFLEKNQASMPGLEGHWHVVGGGQMPNLEATFMSRGDLPSYPDLPFKFCELVLQWFLPIHTRKTWDYEITYTIFTDRAKKKDGKLKLHFQVEG